MPTEPVRATGRGQITEWEPNVHDGKLLNVVDKIMIPISGISDFTVDARTCF
jgi:hypothetical protein